MSDVRIAVVGAGYMGRLHAAKVDALARDGCGVTLAGVVDRDADRARELAAEHAAPGWGSVAEVAERCDAVIVAVPTVNHFPVAREALACDLDVLVEKPVAAEVAEAEALLALARERGRILQVGHQEWFNGAMGIVRDRVRTPAFVEAHRLGPFPERATDVDVVRDLMIHDLEILLQLLGEEPERIEALGVPVVTDKVDIANARLVFPGGCVAHLTASRVSAAPRRRLRFFQRDGYLSVDFLGQKATACRRVDGVNGEVPRIHVEEVEAAPGDALYAQLRAFVGAVRSRDTPLVSGREGLAALRTAMRVVEAMPPLADAR